MSVSSSLWCVSPSLTRRPVSVRSTGKVEILATGSERVPTGLPAEGQRIALGTRICTVAHCQAPWAQCQGLQVSPRWVLLVSGVLKPPFFQPSEFDFFPALSDTVCRIDVLPFPRGFNKESLVSGGAL